MKIELTKAANNNEGVIRFMIPSVPGLTVYNLFKTLRACLVLDGMSVAEAVQMNGLGA